MKIAFASTDNIHVNEHFGWCKRFYMYELKNGKFVFLKAVESKNEISEETDKLNYKIECIKGVDILCASHIGPRASLMVKNAGIFVLGVQKENELIKNILNKLLDMKDANPPLWMQRLLKPDGIVYAREFND
ncbi:MAG: dinitrogenase iron-molybdenum cofactor biosynthesis protein [Campylobacteraceae bacterium]|jgi:nitrogen fixation protein NifX|nr:dinitrogenase iron-molybdenum cofactor biosynthesis protein [Campylobacteraceae bacterium]